MWANLWLPQHGVLAVFLVLLGALSALTALAVELAHKYLGDCARPGSVLSVDRVLTELRSVDKYMVATLTPYFAVNYIIFIALSLVCAVLAYLCVEKIGPNAVGMVMHAPLFVYTIRQDRGFQR